MIYISMVAIILFVACSSINKKLGLEDDNIPEEVIEIILEAKTGLDIDLTPSSPE